MQSIVHDTPAFNSDGILRGDTIISSIQECMPIFHKGNVLPLENADIWEYSCHILSKFSKGNYIQDTAVSKLEGILPGDTCISSIQQSSPTFDEVNASHI